MKITEQLSAIMALPIGPAVLAFATCFFFAMMALVHLVIERKREHRARLRFMAHRFSGSHDDD